MLAAPVAAAVRLMCILNSGLPKANRRIGLNLSVQLKSVEIEVKHCGVVDLGLLATMNGSGATGAEYLDHIFHVPWTGAMFG